MSDRPRQWRAGQPGPDDDAVDRLIDDIVAGRQPPVAGPELGRFVLAAQGVNRLREEPLPADTQTAQLAAIRAHVARTRWPGHEGHTPVVGARRRLAVAAAAVATFFSIGGGGVVALAQHALPGDLLYGLKRASERVAVAFERDPAAAAQLRLHFAERRVTEAGAAPDRAGVLLDEAIAQADRAAGDAAATAVARLDHLLAGGGPAGTDTSRRAIGEACARIAREHGHELPQHCAQAAETSTLRTDNRREGAPGRSRPGPGRAPGRDREQGAVGPQ
ncbi:MAG TPA: DUF5667 domain-containing protein, partial [Nitriliruptorales bacterium]|nr:DUF5667 domain-containing protein [Nitriliruptorales bacterium]